MFKPPYVPSVSIDEEIESQRKLDAEWERSQRRMRLQHDQQLALQKAELNAEIARAEAAAHINQAAPDVFDITNGLSMQNGKVVARPEVPLSQAVIKTQQLTESFEALRNKK